MVEQTLIEEELPETTQIIETSIVEDLPSSPEKSKFELGQYSP